MRTPLSAASMGLSLLHDDMLDDDDGAGSAGLSFMDKHGDVLRMVQDSFQKAEAICADLLQVRRPHSCFGSLWRAPAKAYRLLC
jgi:hypothetical protein